MSYKLRVTLVAKKRGMWTSAMHAGLRRHGIRPRLIKPWWTVLSKLPPETWQYIDASVVITSGWKTGIIFRERGCRVLLIEAGYVGDRTAWASLGWNGLNARARFPPARDEGKRWERYFGGMLQPWRAPDAGRYVLIIGQVTGDASLWGIDILAWYKEAVAVARQRWRWPVVFRPHPRGGPRAIDGAETLAGDLEDALAGAAVVITCTSTVGVQAVLAGIPTIACDRTSMAWPVAAQGLEADLGCPDRTAWAWQLAWCQWTHTEMIDGTAWAHLLACVPKH